MRIEPICNRQSLAGALARAGATVACAGVLTLAASCGDEHEGIAVGTSRPSVSERGAAPGPGAADVLAPQRDLEVTPAATVCFAQLRDLPDSLLPETATIAWQDCRGTWLLDDGQPRLLSPEDAIGGPLISPDRRYVAVPRSAPAGGTDLYLLTVADGSEQLIVDDDAVETLVPVASDAPDGARSSMHNYDWLPDSTGIAFNTWETHSFEEGPGYLKHHDDLWLARPGETEPALLLPQGMGGQFTFSPDGKTVALARRKGVADTPIATIAVANTDGSGHRVLLEHAPVSSESDWTPYQQPAWSADSKNVLVVSPYSFLEQGFDYDRWSGHMAAYDSPVRILRLSLDGDVEQVAHGTGGSLLARRGYNAGWSPGGDFVAYLLPPEAPTPTPPPQSYPPPRRSRAYETPNNRLMIWGFGGRLTEAYDLTRGHVTLFAWSPSGHRFVYLSAPPGADLRHGIPVGYRLRIGSTGLNPMDVTAAGQVSDVRWLSDDVLTVVHSDVAELIRFDHQNQIAERAVMVENAAGVSMAVAPGS